MSKKSMLLYLSLAFTVLSLSFNAHADALGDILQQGKLRVGISLFSPWAMKNSDGTLAGFEVDVAKELAADMGVKPEFQVYDWKNIIQGLEKKEVDIIISGMAITPQRALKINFSQPYAENGITMATNTEMTKDIKTLKQANNEKVVFAVVAETVSSSLAKQVFNKATVKDFTSPDEAASAVINGKAHAYIASTPQPEFLALKHPDKIDMPLNKPLRTNMAGMAVNKGEQELLNFLNSWIIAKKAEEWLKVSHKYWFKTLDWQTEENK